VLIVSDGKRGHVHQTEGVVRKLHNVVGKKLEITVTKPYYIFLVLMSFLARRMKFSQPLILFWIQKTTGASMASLMKFSPDLIISAGSLTHPVTFLLGKIWNCRTVICMRPSILSPRDFDLVIAPRHDERRCRGENIIYTMGATSHISEGFIVSEGMTLWAKLKPAIIKDIEENHHRPLGLLVGGDSALNLIPPEMGGALARETLKTCQANNLYLFSTTSRRTAADTELAVRREIENHPRNAYLLLASESPENPVPGIIGLCEIVIVTEDSVSMVSEIISGGKHAVVVMVGRRKKQNKFQRLFEDLRDEQYITYTTIENLAEDISTLLGMKKQGLKPFDESRKVATEIEKRFFMAPPGKEAIK